MFLGTSQKKGTKYYHIRGSTYDPETGRTHQTYLAYVGKRPVLSQEKAQAICEQHGCSMDDLRAINGLEIEGEAPSRAALDISDRGLMDDLATIHTALRHGDVERALDTELMRLSYELFYDTD